VPPLPPALDLGVAATVNFLLTDIEGSTRQWEKAGEAFRAALEAHHTLLRAGFARHGGREIKEAGDSFLVAFASARSALTCAVAPSRRLPAETGPGVGPLRVRMAMHTGDVEIKGGEYHGLPLHRASRMLTAAHGRPDPRSEITAGLVRRDLAEDVRLVDLACTSARRAQPRAPVPGGLPGHGAARLRPAVRARPATGRTCRRLHRFFGREREITELPSCCAPAASGW
jgi:class 3 adenylate cyclase